MALGAAVGSTAFGQSQAVTNALVRARLTGRPVNITNPDGSVSSLVAYPQGTVGTLGGGYGGGGSRGYAGIQGAPGTPSGAAVAAPAATSSLISNQPVGARTGLFTPVAGQVGSTITAPNVTSPLSTAPYSGYDLGLNIGTPVATTQPQPVQAPLNQANPNTTYVSPNTAQPAGAVPVTGQAGTQSGPATTLASQARAYRVHHGLATSDDTDALNTESLAAAQAGRTSFDPTLAAQYGQQPAAGVYGPRTDVVNALTAPTTTTQDAATQQAQNLLQQGIY